MEEQSFKLLFEPLNIGTITLKNRFVFYPQGTGWRMFDREDGAGWWDRQAYWYAEIAKGGAGLITASDITPHISGAGLGFRTIDERDIPHLKKVSEMVHSNGAKLVQMIHHVGSACQNMLHNHPGWTASAIRPCPPIGEITHEMDKEEINEMIRGYAKTSKILEQAGYDGVELQAAHGFLIESFLSPFSNKRTDEYGGSLEKRMRFVLEIINAIRAEVSPEFVLGIAYSPDEGIPGGISIDGQGVEIARRLEATEKIDYLAISRGHWIIMPMWIGDATIPSENAVPLAEAVKNAVNIPVSVVGRIRDPANAEKILSDTDIDLIGMARALNCDPEFPNKIKEGRLDDIRLNESSAQSDIGRLLNNLDIQSLQNPAMGREKKYGIGRLKPAKVKKKVIIVGGGPGGLKAAESAAERGHSVTLYEKTDKLGGQINLATKLTALSEFKEITRYLEHQIKKLKVNIVLNTEVTPELVKKQSPDSVVIATGAIPVLPPIPGMDQENVVMPEQILKGEVEAGNKVVVWDAGEGYWRCAGISELLINQGKEVTIVTPFLCVGEKLPFTVKYLLHGRLLGAKDLTMKPLATIKEIAGNRVVICDSLFGQKEDILEDIDTVVAVCEKQVCYDLLCALKGQVKEIFSVGDCVCPRLADVAIWEGFKIGREI